MLRLSRHALAACACVALTPVLAQPAPDPLDPKAPVRAAVYESTFARTRPADTPPLPWRDANARVERIGGWRAYAREAASPPPAAGASSPAHHHGAKR
jgi:hypothetical protein